jgi:threonine/homoserine/homoserine lactone efflux protein
MTLEGKYRRLIRLFPAGWRREHEEELVGTLLDAAEPGRTAVSFADGADLVRSAGVLWYRALRAGDHRLTRQTARRAALAAAMLSAALTLALVLRSGVVPAAFLLTSLVVALIPGTGVFYTVSSAIGGGWRRGLFAAVGCTLGVIPHIVAAMLGLSGIMQIGAVVFEVVRYAGVLYLVLMGVAMIRDRGEMILGGTDAASGSRAVVVRRGVLLNLLNPKLTIFFFAFLPQFLGASPHLLDAKLIALGGIFMLITFAVFALYAYASAALRERVLGAPAARRWFQRVLGALLIGFGLKLAIAER